MRVSYSLRVLFFVAAVFAFTAPQVRADGGLSPDQLLSVRQVYEAAIDDGGERIAYVMLVPRTAADPVGSTYRQLHIVDVATGTSRPYVTGDENVYDVAWVPGMDAVSFRMKRGKGAKTQVWMIPVNGGEARQVTDANTSVSEYRWSPDGKRLAYIAETPATAREKALEDKGYDFVFYEENLKHRNIYLVDVTDGVAGKARQLTDGMTAWDLEFSPDGKTIAAGMSPQNLIDHRYAFQHVYLVDIANPEPRKISRNDGKLGNWAFSPDGKHLAYAASLDRKDHAVSQAYVVPVGGGAVTNLTPAGFKGHIEWVGWKDNGTVVYRAGEGVYPTLSTVPRTGGERKVVLDSRTAGFIFDEPPSMTAGMKHVALVAQSPEMPGDLYYWRPGKSPKRLTNANPWLADVTLGKQEPFSYAASDGVEVHGILIYPVGYESGRSYPLIVQVHGGPEAHYSNGWISRYANPGQVFAGKGYLVFYPNYRASTGYGVEYAAAGYNDAAGREFDDIADGIKYLVAEGMADGDRVGLGGGSYGGFASAWFSSYYTDLVNAVCMFVGISDLISKRGTTDIPYEELYVHSGKKLEEMWEQSLQRSPIYHAHKSKTAVLIYGGQDDTRVHPSQSLEYYRRLKMNDHPAVRLVQYPGEQHGNSKQPGRMDVLYRQLSWYDWYVMDNKPIDGPMPPLDLSDRFGLDLPE